MPWTVDRLVRAGSLILVVLAAIVSIRLFLAIDADTGSTTDTLIGFVPNDLVIWALALAGIWLLRRAGRSSRLNPVVRPASGVRALARNLWVSQRRESDRPHGGLAPRCEFVRLLPGAVPDPSLAGAVLARDLVVSGSAGPRVAA